MALKERLQTCRWHGDKKIIFSMKLKYWQHLTHTEIIYVLVGQYPGHYYCRRCSLYSRCYLSFPYSLASWKQSSWATLKMFTNEIFQSPRLPQFLKSLSLPAEGGSLWVTSHHNKTGLAGRPQVDSMCNSAAVHKNKCKASCHVNYIKMESCWLFLSQKTVSRFPFCEIYSAMALRFTNRKAHA